jgi:hypothetical protein
MTAVIATTRKILIARLAWYEPSFYPKRGLVSFPLPLLTLRAGLFPILTVEREHYIT